MNEEELRKSLTASTINQKKAYIFSVGWWLRNRYGFRKYPEAYDVAKKFIGTRSLVFNMPQWPKKFERGPLQQQMRMFYSLMEKSLGNNEWQVNQLCESLLLYHSYYYHKFVTQQICQSLWADVVTDMPATKMPYTKDSRALACKVYDSEDFGIGVQILCDSLDDTGFHDSESDHLRMGLHTPACPILRKIAGIK